MLCSIGLQHFNNEPVAIILGIHNDDAIKGESSDVAAYPDCTLEFAEATNKALQLSTAGLCHLYTPLVNMTKAVVAELGVSSGMIKEDFQTTISCYNGLDKKGLQCGKCPTCIDRIKALIKAGIYKKPEEVLLDYNIDLKAATSFFNL